MTKQISHNIALSLLLCGLALSASLSMAQSTRAGLGRMGPWHGHASKAVTPAAQIPPPPGSTSYAFTYLSYPQSPYTSAYSLNLGAKTWKTEIVGAYGPAENVDGWGSGFLLNFSENKTKGTFTETFSTVNIPGSSMQLAGGINDFGEIVGYYFDDSGNVQGYLLSGGTFTEIQVPFAGATSTLPSDINNSGEIVGIWEVGGNPIQSFTLTGGVYSQLAGYPGAIETQVISINNKGEIAGYYEDSAGNYHGFLLSGGTYTSIDVPGAAGTLVFGVNDLGEVVGTYCTASGCLTTFQGLQGFLLTGGVFTTIDVPTANSTEIGNINNKGEMVGWYYDSAGAQLAFIATP